ncbi:MAG: hypothetical protein ACRC2T_02300, partial [Thermoguttaceae bacterium]
MNHNRNTHSFSKRIPVSQLVGRPIFVRLVLASLSLFIILSICFATSSKVNAQAATPQKALLPTRPVPVRPKTSPNESQKKTSYGNKVKTAEKSSLIQLASADEGADAVIEQAVQIHKSILENGEESENDSESDLENISAEDEENYYTPRNSSLDIKRSNQYQEQDYDDLDENSDESFDETDDVKLPNLTVMDDTESSKSPNAANEKEGNGNRKQLSLQQSRVTPTRLSQSQQQNQQEIPTFPLESDVNPVSNFGDLAGLSSPFGNYTNSTSNSAAGFNAYPNQPYTQQYTQQNSQLYDSTYGAAAYQQGSQYPGLPSGYYNPYMTYPFYGYSNQTPQNIAFASYGNQLGATGQNQFQYQNQLHSGYFNQYQNPYSNQYVSQYSQYQGIQNPYYQYQSPYPY